MTRRGYARVTATHPSRWSGGKVHLVIWGRSEFGRGWNTACGMTHVNSRYEPVEVPVYSLAEIVTCKKCLKKLPGALEPALRLVERSTEAGVSRYARRAGEAPWNR